VESQRQRKNSSIQPSAMLMVGNRMWNDMFAANWARASSTASMRRPTPRPRRRRSRRRPTPTRASAEAGAAQQCSNDSIVYLYEFSVCSRCPAANVRPPPGQRTRPSRRAFQVHLDARVALVEEGHMAPVARVEVGADQAVHVAQQVQVERGSDAERIVVGRLRARRAT
jgi:hypothetical protein